MFSGNDFVTDNMHHPDVVWPSSVMKKFFQENSYGEPETVQLWNQQQISDQDLKKTVSGWLCKTAQARNILTRNSFIVRFYELDQETGILRVYESDKRSKVKQEI